MNRISFALLLLCSLQLQAQKVFVSEGLSLNTVRYFEPLGKVRDYYYMFATSDEKWLLTAYDAQMRPHQKRELEFSNAYKEVEIFEAYVYQERLLICFVHELRGKKTVRMHAYEMSGQLSDSVEVASIGDRINVPYFTSSLAENKRHLVLFADNINKELTLLNISSDSLKCAFEHRLALPKQYENDAFLSVLPDEIGGVFVAMDQYNYHAEREKHRFLLHHYASTGKETTSVLDLQGALTNDAKFIVTPSNQRLKIIGLYTLQNHTQSHGYWNYTWKADALGTARPDFQPFPQRFARSMSDVENVPDSSIQDLKLLPPLLRSDGGIVMLVERSKEINRINNSPRMVYRDVNTSMKDYYREQLGLLSINASGEIEWQNLLYKKQFSYDDDATFSSVGYLTNNKQLSLLYNDEIKVDGIVSEFQVNSSGKSSRRPLFSTQGQDILIAFPYLIQTGLNEAIAPSMFHNKLRLVRIVFDQ